jgi:ribosomal protein S18 acetylase RimI-like enzyme
MQSMAIRPMRIEDYDEVVALWTKTAGICLRAADSREAIGRYLERNPGLSFVAVSNGKVIGAVLSGHDGRRGFIHHLAVDDGHRRKGLGKQLFASCVHALEKEGILKTHLFVLNENGNAFEFWKKAGCVLREDIATFTHNRSPDPAS